MLNFEDYETLIRMTFFIEFYSFIWIIIIIIVKSVSIIVL